MQLLTQKIRNPVNMKKLSRLVLLFMQNVQLKKCKTKNIRKPLLHDNTDMCDLKINHWISNTILSRLNTNYSRYLASLAYSDNRVKG